jgi:uncharacterized protein (DUF1778 family)
VSLDPTIADACRAMADNYESGSPLWTLFTRWPEVVSRFPCEAAAVSLLALTAAAVSSSTTASLPRLYPEQRDAAIRHANDVVAIASRAVERLVAMLDEPVSPIADVLRDVAERRQDGGR